MPNRAQSLRLAAIVFTDIVGYSAVINRDAVLGAKLLDRQRSVVRKCVPPYGGREVETAGDSFLLEFPSALKALECVADIQRQLAQANEPHPESERVRIRASIHLGDVEHRAKEVFGDGVNVAARILPFSPEGGVAFSETVQQQVRNRIQVLAKSIGSPPLKNIAHPIEIFTLDAPSTAAIQSTAIPDVDVPAQRTRTIWIPVAGLLGCALTAAALFWFQRHETVVSDHRAIAVLPFASFSSDAANDFLAEGIHENLLTNLARIGSLKVISRTSVMSYKDRKVPLPQIGRDLGVGAIVEGSVQRSGERVLVHVQLIDAASDQHLWANSFNRAADDIFAVESELAEQIAAAVNVALSPQIKQAIDRAPTKNPEAYRLYVEARHLLLDADPDPKDDERAESLINRALELDPDFALAHVALANKYLNDYAGGRDRRETKLEMARSQLQRAAQLSPDAPELHLAWGEYYYSRAFNLDAALSEFEAVLRVVPGSADAHGAIARVLRRKGQLADAITHLRRASELDPNAWDPAFNLVTTYNLARNYAAAGAALDHLLAQHPDDYSDRLFRESIRLDATGDPEPLKKALHAAPPEYWAHDPDYAHLQAAYIAEELGEIDDAIAHREKVPQNYQNMFGEEATPRESELARLYALKGDRTRSLELYRKAAETLQDALRKKDSPSTNDYQRAALAEADAALGKTQEAHRLLDGVKSSPGYSDPFRRHELRNYMARAYLTLGETDAALDQIEALLTQPSFGSPQSVRRDGSYKSLHGNPRFERILSQAQAQVDVASRSE